MALLLISFFAGLLTVLAPCVLPLLPVIVGGSVDGEKNVKKPLVITLSLAGSIVLFTLLLKFSTAFIDIPQSVWAFVSGAIIIVFGLITLFPVLWETLSLKFNFLGKSNELLSASAQKQSHSKNILIGAALGPVFSSCSPTYFLILATVLPQSFATGVLYLLVYALGLSIALFAIAFLGQRLVHRLGWAANPHGWFKRILGILFLLVGIAIVTGVDKKVEANLLERRVFDRFANLETRLLSEKKTDMPQEAIESASDTAAKKEIMKKYYPPYREITNPSGYVNTDPFTLKDIVGDKIVMIDFMTYTCINCVRTFPYLNAWYDTYKDAGLEIVGIHTPEFAFEKNKSNVETAMKKYGITFPIVLDNDYGTWRAYGNNYWPRKYIIDLDGNIVYDHIGEGGYVETEEKIRALLRERNQRRGIAAELPGPVSSEIIAEMPNRVGSPETYVGAARNETLLNGEAGVVGTQTLTLPKQFLKNGLYMGGTWTFAPEYAKNDSRNAKIVFRYDAKNVYLVLKSDKERVLTIRRDGVVVSDERGADVDAQGTLRVNEDKMYWLIEEEISGEHVLEIEIDEPGLEVYAFTFG